MDGKALEIARRWQELDRHPAWVIVRRWTPITGRPLSAHAKMAWQHIFLLGDCEVEAWHAVHSAEIADHQGINDRGGRRALQDLAAEGLIDIVDRKRGRYDCYLRDPQIAARARRVSAVDHSGSGDLLEKVADPEEQPPVDADAVEGGATLPLRRLPAPSSASAISVSAPFPTPASQAAEYVQIPPAEFVQKPPFQHQESSIRCLNTSARARALEHLTPTPCVETAEFAQKPPDPELAALAAHQARTSRPDPELPTLGDAVAGRLDQLAERLENAVAPAAQSRRIASVAAWIAAEVADPVTYATTFERVAEAIVCEGFPELTVRQILRRLRDHRAAGTLTARPGSYFQRSAQIAMERRGIPWRLPQKG